MKWWLLLLVAAAPLAAQAQQGPSASVDTSQAVSVVVPIVGATPGPNNILWKTNVELTNTEPRDLSVALILPTAPDQPAMITTIGAGQTIRYGDIVAEAFGLDHTLSPLVVATMGRRSINVRATVYGIVDGTVTQPQPIAVSYGDTYAPIRLLPGLSFSDDYRTNIGLANLGDEDASFVIALQRLPGRNLAVTRVVLPPQSLWHTAVQSMFPLISKGEDFSVLIETSARSTYVYGSVIENATSTARFIQPLVGTTFNLGVTQ